MPLLCSCVFLVLHLQASAAEQRVSSGFSEGPYFTRLARLRASALAALGMLGGEEDKALIEECADSGLYRVRKVARVALTRLKEDAENRFGVMKPYGLTLRGVTVFRKR